MTILRTRHSLEFNLVSNSLESHLYPYAKRYDDYITKRNELGRLVGSNNFIWCIPASRCFKYYERIKPVEWVIEVRDDRILGCVHDQKWFDYLEGRVASLDGVYFRDSSPENEYSVLVSHLLQDDEIKEMRIFRFIDPDHADTLCEKHF